MQPLYATTYENGVLLIAATNRDRCWVVIIPFP